MVTFNEIKQNADAILVSLNELSIEDEGQLYNLNKDESISILKSLFNDLKYQTQDSKFFPNISSYFNNYWNIYQDIVSDAQSAINVSLEIRKIILLGIRELIKPIEEKHNFSLKVELIEFETFLTDGEISQSHDARSDEQNTITQNTEEEKNIQQILNYQHDLILCIMGDTHKKRKMNEDYKENNQFENNSREYKHNTTRFFEQNSYDDVRRSVASNFYFEAISENIKNAKLIKLKEKFQDGDGHEVYQIRIECDGETKGILESNLQTGFVFIDCDEDSIDVGIRKKGDFIENSTLDIFLNAIEQLRASYKRIHKSLDGGSFIDVTNITNLMVEDFKIESLVKK